jgi:hypothetical protein
MRLRNEKWLFSRTVLETFFLERSGLLKELWT